MTPLFSKEGITLIRKESSGTHTLIVDRGENKFNPQLVTDLASALRIVEDAPHPKSLVIVGRGKFFSSGLDLDWMLSDPTGAGAMIDSVRHLLARVLVLDCRTVAAINGHAFGAGLFLALACDARVMRTKRGYVNFPELNFERRLARGSAELAKAKLDAKTLREGAWWKWFGSTDAVEAGLVDAECHIECLEGTAEKMADASLAESFGTERFDASSLKQMKLDLYTDAYRSLAPVSVDAKLVAAQE
eukprot:CAMPEP_0197465022 /NCGR_PEP_ID=MMETSP1175-20131217/64325_1 /TAXON_ID=1003142 /ORGANISM="Triceratium dubium, Strain CCMP147" /LENGTH=245 /DNA_ID=CAMNT_0043001027 /DNA_START=1031 /DNA_END=1768 /DNA_ORIENTATION=+